MSRLIAPSKALGYSKFYLDYLAGEPSARQFFLADSVERTALDLDRSPADRSRIIEILRRQNRAFGASERAMTAIEKLSDPAAICVFAGQQAGLFTSSTLVQLKALGITKYAATLSRSLNRPVIPIFWIAGDDHDFAEVNHTFLVNAEGALEEVRYRAAQSVELPLGLTYLSDDIALNEAKSDLRRLLGETAFTNDLYSTIDRCYTSAETFVTAFGKCMAAMTAPYETVYFSPTDPDVSRLAEPFYQSVIAHRDDIRTAFHDTNERILRAGYHLQVEKSDSAAHLFFTGEQGRKPILLTEAQEFSFDGRTYSVPDFIALVRAEPNRITPDAILRPVLQSYLFPAVAQFGGPSEIAYLAQLNPLFRVLGVVTPVHLPRPTATLVEKKFEKVLAEYDIQFEDLTGDIEQAINRIMERTFPADLEARFREVGTDISERFGRFAHSAVEFDAGLKDFVKQTAGKLDFTLKTFEEKVFSAHKRKSKETRDRIYRLHTALYPNRGPQDRTLNIAYFIAKYGPGVISFVYNQLKVDEASHQLLFLSEMSD